MLNGVKKAMNMERIILGGVKTAIQNYVIQKNLDMPYEYALYTASEDELKQNSKAVLEKDVANDMGGNYFDYLTKDNWIKLESAPISYDRNNDMIVKRDIRYSAGSKYIAELKSEALQSILSQNELNTFEEAKEHLKKDSIKYGLTDFYYNMLGSAKDFYVKKIEKEIDAKMSDELEQIKVLREEEKNT